MHRLRLFFFELAIVVVSYEPLASRQSTPVSLFFPFLFFIKLPDFNLASTAAGINQE